MNKKTTLLTLVLFTAFGLRLHAQDLVGTSSITFNNSDPCVIDFSFQYTNAGTVDAGPNKVSVFLTEDMFFADPDFDILATELYNGQGVPVGQVRTFTGTAIDLTTLSGFQSGTNYFVYYFLDRDNEVSETNENNNLANIGNTTCTTVNVDAPLEDHISLELFPNPTADKARLSWELGQAEELTVRIFDLNGRSVYESQVEGSSTGRQELVLDLAGWQSGMYSVQVQVGEKTTIQKLFVQ